jgi:hypothetical protein
MHERAAAEPVVAGGSDGPDRLLSADPDVGGFVDRFVPAASPTYPRSLRREFSPDPPPVGDGPPIVGSVSDPVEHAADQAADLIVPLLRRTGSVAGAISPVPRLSPIPAPLRRSPATADRSAEGRRAAADLDGLRVHTAPTAADLIARLLRRTGSVDSGTPQVPRLSPVPAPLRRSAATADRSAEGDAAGRPGRRATMGPGGGVLPALLADRLAGERGSGTELPAVLRRGLESAVGADLGGVRVHTGAVASELNRAMDAQAFTQGNDIYFRDGIPDTSSDVGVTVLAHEIAHTLQSARNPPLRRRIRRSLFAPFKSLQAKPGSASTLRMDQLAFDGLSYSEGGTLGNSVNMEHMVSNTGGSSSPGEPAGIWMLRSVDQSLVWANGQMTAATAMHAINGDFTHGTNDEARNIFMGSRASNTDLHFHMVEKPIRAAFQSNPTGQSHLYETELARTPPMPHPTMPNILVWCGPNAVPGTQAVGPMDFKYDHTGLPGHVTNVVSNPPSESEARKRPRFVQYHVTANYTYSPYPALPTFLMGNINRSLQAISAARSNPGEFTEEQISNQERATRYLCDHAHELFPQTFSCEAVYWVASYIPATPWYQQTDRGTYEAQKPGSKRSLDPGPDEDESASKKSKTDQGGVDTGPPVASQQGVGGDTDMGDGPEVIKQRRKVKGKRGQNQ